MHSPAVWKALPVILMLVPLSLSLHAQGELPEGTINALAIDARMPAPHYYAVTDQGIFTSRDPAAGWISVSSPEETINDVAISPADPTVLLAAAGDAGVMKSTDGGSTWDPANAVREHRSTDRGTTGNSLVDDDIRAVAFAPSAPAVAVAGSFNGVIYRSDNAAGHWVAVNPDNPLTALNTLAIHPADPDTIYAGTGGDGVLRSTDGGKNWTRMNNGLTDTTVTRMVIDPVNPDLVYAGTYGGGVFRSSDGGSNWQPAGEALSSPFVYSLAVMPRAPADGASGGFLGSVRRMVSRPAPSALYAGVYGGDVFRSADGGASWQPLGAE